ncbi:MAG: PVC-type heme-binding CxxCH protein [Cyclobacteriaceae bacterium]
MNIIKVSSLIFSGLLLFTGCQDKKSEQEKLADDSRFTGKKFSEHIRSTEARTPQEEQSGFKLPDGFEIELYASEPDIGKPINLTFDAKGRLWVTQSFEYPFPASPGHGSDRITILEDTDKNGKADRFTNFSDTLNIPIGIFPLLDGAVAYSIPNVYRFTDSNGDGKADSKRVVLGPFEHRDTHGMVNNFMRGYDGWIHACHGFTNRSTVAGADGDSITMISGNTFRFRPDGSRVEHITHGRINPFGLAYDEMGYLYSTDCHTSPLYQLIRGADYTQWGKEEGMGFAPDMKPLEREATALAGIAYYADGHYPKEYQSNFYIGDAVASRVYRNSFTFKGSTPVGKLEEEFVLSEDPWFRPVDIKLGPDGALYIADFYNSIIGHYEVPLNHPKRDKIRGRIWRITYKGKSNELRDLMTASPEDLISSLDHDNLVVRLAAADQLAERIGKTAAGQVTQLVNSNDVSARAYIHGLWVLHRLDGLSMELIERSAAHDHALIRLHTMRILLEKEHPDNTYFNLISKALQDTDPHVRRAATEVLVKFPDMPTLATALSEPRYAPEYDSHQIYTTRLVLRNLLRNSALMKDVVAKEWRANEARYIADVIIGVPSEDAALFLARHIDDSDWKGDHLTRLYEHLARYIPSPQLEEVIANSRQTKGDDIDFQYTVFKGIQQGIARRGAKESAQLKSWGAALATSLLEKYSPEVKKPSGDTLAKQKFAADIAGKYKMRSLEPVLLAFLKEGSGAGPDVKVSALRSLLILDANKHASLAGRILKDTVPSQFKNQVASLLGDFSGAAINNVLAGVENAPPDLQSAIVMSLAASPEGKNIIFRKVKSGELLPRTLIQPKVEERIMLNISPRQQQEFKTITAKLEPISKERQTLIDTRLIEFSSLTEKASLDSGKMVFKQNCSACHAIGNEGGAIGPRLDGVGKWGPRALAEKILDPNRNVSEAFRNYTITLKDGKVMSGLFRREEGAVIVLADVSGKEFSVPKNDIAEQKASKYTLMPDHFGDVLSQEEFNSLLQYLLSLQS